MHKSQFEAGTFGVGELITQRKLFRVPRHQRSYAWSREAVTTFLSDVEAAFASNASEYFIGLVVIQGPEDGEWVLLDGQQRLTTSTMLFAAIRNWLNEHSLLDDARQIETEFLGVRRLGGEYSSRMQLNEENQEYFKSAVIDPDSAASLNKMLPQLPKKSSNKLLLEAAIECQSWVNSIANSVTGDTRNKAERLFRLASFVESKVKVVCVEVSSDVDAYVLFESLNDRGIELSALDLLKNYAYSKSIAATAPQFDRHWQRLVSLLEDRNPDEFLKISWTARHGVVQKTQLFRNIRNRYRTQNEVLEFLATLANDAAILTALEDPEHVMWNDYPPGMRNNLHTLALLGSRQTRPVLLAAVSGLAPDMAEILAWYLIVVVVRFQIIGRGRTGIMEKVFGRLCVEIASGSARGPDAFRRILYELSLSDDEFTEAFARHRDSRLVRFAYFLAALEVQEASGLQQPATTLGSVRELLARTTLVKLSPDSAELDEELEAPVIGELALMEPELAAATQPSMLSRVKSSRFALTAGVAAFAQETEVNFDGRSRLLAAIAARTWRLY